ncbi:GNAT family N-acetyltransferase [Polycladidibacter stylochi]|uniref:GNAT family N-acetyltransferase n=1 Tax=Polycladidibacter stylochi TaxID=1807766 RepID=UPI000829E215|nr:GNAT family N-acetyltransferase [Pseudovibrio stylochi]
MSGVFTWHAFDRLTVQQLYAVLKLRQDVFIVEQACPYPDTDGEDGKAWHLLYTQGEDGVELAGYLRVFLGDAAKGKASKIGRVVVDKAARGQGVAQKMLSLAVEYCQNKAPRCPIELEAQVYAQALYKAAGFEAVGEVFLEDGIEHILMRRSFA